MDDRELVAITPRMAEAGKAKLIELGYEGVEFTDAQKVYLAMLEASPAALAKAGRLASEVKGDVVEAVAAIIAKEHGHCGQFLATQVASVIAADAERRVLEKADLAIRQCASIDGNGYFCEKAKAIAAIRALLTPSPAAQPEGER